MNKAMSKIAQINKEELSKVELALVDDFNKALDQLKTYDRVIGKKGQDMFNVLSDIQVLGRKLNDAYDGAFDFVEEAEQEIDSAVKIVDKLAASAKELGIDPKSIKGTSEIVKVVANLEDTINTLNKNKNEVKGIINAL